MNQFESEKKKGWFGKSYALSLIIAIEGEKTLQSEFRLAKAAVLDWVAHRGKDGDAIQMVIILKPEDVPASRAYIEEVYYNEGHLAPIFQRLKFFASFIDIDVDDKLLDCFDPNGTLPPSFYHEHSA